MNWKWTAIVVVGVLCLIGIGGVIYAIVKIGQSAATNQKNSVVYHTLDTERAQCNSKDADESIRGCTAILQRSSDSGDQAYAHFQRGIAYEHSNELDQAIADDSKVVSLTPREYMAWVNRSHAYQRKGDLKHAMADLNKAISLDPEMMIAWESRSKIERLQHNYQAAIDDFSNLIKIEKTNFVAWRDRCYFRALAGQLNDALADCNQSLALKPGTPATLDSRGFTYLKMKKYDLAIRDYDAALRLVPALAPSLYGRGLAKRATHDLRGADTDIHAAIAIDAEIEETFRRDGVS